MITPEMAQMLHDAEQSMVPDDLRAAGWVYRDFPGRTTPEGWNKLLNVMGHDNYKIVVMSSGLGWRRGQFFLSPKAIENMKKFLADNKSPSGVTVAALP